MRIDNDPWRDLKQFVDNSPYLQIKAISTPLLMLQGGEDFGTNDAEKLFLGLKKMDRTAQLAIYSGGGHGVGGWERANIVDAVQRVMDFLHRHLQGG
jgi:dipeptidyl aminopeptidase/acylaminoacyl peptidase